MKQKTISRGYTLVELMVTLSVFVLVMTMVMSYYDPRPKKREEMRGQMMELLTLFESARGYAISNTTIEIIPGGEQVVPSGGYGIYMDFPNKQFTIFADVNDPNPADGIASSAGNGAYDPAQDHVLKVVTVTNPNLTFSGLLGDATEYTQNPITIIFIPPNGNSLISGNINNIKMDMKVEHPSILIENITFNRISGFFERSQIIP